MPEDTATEPTPVTLSTCLQISDTTTVTGSGNIYSFTSAETFRLNNFSGDTAALWDYYGGSTAENAYVSIMGTFKGESSLSATPESLPGGYHAYGNVVVAVGASLTVEEDACISMCTTGSATSCFFYVRGSFYAEHETAADLFVSNDCPYTYFIVQNGGDVHLRNANINLQDSSGWARVFVTNGSLSMEGGSLKLGEDYNSRLYVEKDGLLNLSGVDVGGYVDVYGRATIRGGAISRWVSVRTGGELNMDGSTVKAPLLCSDGSRVTLTNSIVASTLGIYGNATLDNVLCGMLQLGDVADFTVGDGGLTIAAPEVVRFNGCSRDYADFLRSFNWRATAKTTYVGVWNVLEGDAKMDSLEGLVTDGYHMVADTTLATGAALTMGEGVRLQLDGSRQFTVQGRFSADNETVADVLTSWGDDASVRILIQDGGTMDLRNANIRLQDSQGGSRIQVDDGVLNMEGGILDLGAGEDSGTIVGAGGVLNLAGVDVADKVEIAGTASISDGSLAGPATVKSGGSLKMEDVAVSAAVTCQAGATLELDGCTGITSLTINKNCASSSVRNCDLSRTSVDLSGSGGGAIDLSGNYWGTTDIDAVLERISGYDAGKVVLTSVLSAPPAQTFSFAPEMEGRHVLAEGSTRVVLLFNREVDASTVGADTLSLVDVAGNRVAVSSYEVDGASVTLHFAPLEVGVYRIVASSSLKDTSGEGFAPFAGMEGGVVYTCPADPSPKVVLVQANSTVSGHFNCVDIFFDQRMDASSITPDKVHIRDAQGREIPVTRCIQSSRAGNTYYRFYFEAVTASGSCTVGLDPSICTEGGVPFASAWSKELYISSPNLAVLAGHTCSQNKSGRVTTVSYTVINSGDGVAMGSWMDTVYLCRTSEWDPTQAVVFGRAWQDNMELAAGGAYTGCVTGVLNELPPGEYYIFVTTDEGNRLCETEDARDNVSPTGTFITISHDLLALDSPVQTSIATLNESACFQYAAGTSGTVCLELDTPHAKVSVAEDRMPSEGKLPSHSFSLNGKTYVYFQALAGRDYFVKVGGVAGTVSVCLSEPRFSIDSISAATLIAGQDMTVQITGSGLPADIRFYLEDANGNTYDAKSVSIESSNQASATFRLAGVAGGTQLTLKGCSSAAGQTVACMAPVTAVTYADSIDVSFSKMNLWSYTSRVGYVWKCDLSAVNKSAYDMDSALVLVTDTASNFAMYYGYSDALCRDRSALLLDYGNLDATKGVMTAGESERQDVYVKHYRSGTGAIQAWLLQPDDDTELSDKQWSQVESALRPGSCNNAKWTAWWGDIKPRIGSTVADFVAFYHGMQDAVAAAGGKASRNMADLVAQAMTLVPDYVPNRLVKGILHKGAAREAVSGVNVRLYKKQGGSAVFIGETWTDASGRYVLASKGDGDYFITTSKGIDLDADGFEETHEHQFSISGEDVELDLSLSYEDDIPYLGHNSPGAFEVAGNGDGGWLWERDGVLCFAVIRDERWICSDIISTAAVSDYSVVWDEDTGSFLLVWKADGDTAEPCLWLQTVARNADGTYTPHSAVRLSDYAAQYDAKLIRSDSKLYMVPSPTSDHFTVDINDSVYWRYQGDASQELPTTLTGWLDGPPTNSLQSSVTLDLPFIGEVTLSGKNDVLPSDDCCNREVVWTYRFEKEKEKVRTKPTYKWNVVTGFAQYERSLAYHYENGKKTSKLLSETYSLGLNMDSPQGLILAMKAVPIPVVNAIGQAFDVVRLALSKVGVTLICGYEIEVAGSLTRGEGQPTILSFNKLSPTLKIGVESKKREAGLTVSGGFDVNLDFDMTNCKVVNEPRVSGNVTLEIKLPKFLGIQYSYSRSWDFRAPAEQIDQNPSIVYHGDPVPLVCLSGSETIDGIRYSFWTDEVDGKSAFHLSASDVETGMDIGISGTLTGDLVSGRGYIEELFGYNDAGSLVIVVKGYVFDGDITLGTTLTQQEMESVYQTVCEGMRTEVIRVRDSQMDFNDETPSGEVIDSSDIDFGTGARWVEIVKTPGGMYRLVDVRIDADSNVRQRRVILETEDRLVSCSARTTGGKYHVNYTVCDSAHPVNVVTYQAIEQSNGSWFFRKLSGGNPDSGETGRSSVSGLSATEADIWAMLSECPEKEPEPVSELPHKSFQSFDPNDILGPQGFGVRNWIANGELAFMIECENEAKENIAHAAMVTINHQLDAALDWSTFRLGSIMIAGNYFDMPEEDLQNYRGRITDWVDSLGVYVDVDISFDAETGKVTWNFVAIDPETLEIVPDVFKGLLAPNFASPEGEAYVNYFITPKADAVSGTEFSAKADIVFDYNAPIETPTLTYTLDVDAPNAVMQGLAAEGSGRYIRLDWSGEDASSGIASYDIYVSVDGGNWAYWRTGTKDTAGLYAAQDGRHIYSFLAAATDNAGNREILGVTEGAECGTLHTYDAGALTAELDCALVNDRFELRLTFSGEVVPPASWADALSATGVDWAMGKFSYDAASRTLTWAGTVNTDAIPSRMLVQVKEGAVVDKAGHALAESTLSLTPSATLSAAEESTYAAPALYDYDGDGLLDLVVGVKTADGKGAVRVHLNTGSAGQPKFASSFTYIMGADGGSPLTVEAAGCQGAIVRFADLDADGTDEMIIGLADGSVLRYTKGADGWEAAGALTCSVGGKESDVKAASRAALEFADLDGDGATDLLVGTGDGYIVWYRNNAADGAFSLAEGHYLYDADGLIKPGSRASVAVADVDGDGLADLLVGSGTGQVLYYRNLGEVGIPLFGNAVKVAGGDFSAVSDRVRIDAADLDGDGVADLVVGLSDGSVRVAHGTSGWGSVGTVTVAGEGAPDAPFNLEMRRRGASVRFSWGAVVGEGITYLLRYTNTETGETKTMTLPSTSQSLDLPDGAYTWSVRSMKPDGAWSQPTMGDAFVVDTVAPDSPAGLVSAEVQGGDATLAWGASADAAAYEIRYRAGGGAWTTVRVGDDTASLPLHGLANGAYSWQVRAVDAAGNASAWSMAQHFEVTDSAATATAVWVRGVMLDAAGNVAFGYQDAAKTGQGDSNLCWAAAAGNMLAWWQGFYGTVGSLSASNRVPENAADIFADIAGNWDNASGMPEYGCIWWLSGTADSAAYMEYYGGHYTGSANAGAYYKDFYTQESVSSAASTQKLGTLSAVEVSESLSGVMASGGIAALNLYGTLNGGSLGQGHTVTLWGASVDATTGLLVSVSVTDSDDGKDGVVTLELAYDEASGYYRVAEGAAMGGYYLGSYSSLSTFDAEAPGTVPDLALLQTPGSRTLVWSPAQDLTEVSYVVEYSRNADFCDAATLATSACKLLLPESADNALFFRVKAVDVAGNESGWSALELISATTKAKKVTFAWPEVEGAVNYVVTITRADGSGKPVVKKGKKTTLSVSLKDADYNWTVQAATKAGEVLEEMSGRTFQVDSIAPTKVKNLTSAAKEAVEGNTIAVVSWEAAADVSAVHYLVEYCDNKGFKKGTVQTLETTDTTAELSVTPGQYVHYRITAVDSFGNKSKQVKGSYGEPAIAPATVEDPVVDGKKVSLAWAAVEGAKSYIVKFTNAAGKVTTKTFKTNSAVVSLADGDYTWSVQAVSTAGIKSAVTGAEGQGFMVDVTAPKAVTKLTAVRDGREVTLTWSAAKDTSAVHYKVQYSDTKDFSNLLGGEDGITDTSYSMEVDGGMTLYYRVMAIDAVDHVSKWASGNLTIKHSYEIGGPVYVPPGYQGEGEAASLLSGAEAEWASGGLAPEPAMEAAQPEAPAAAAPAAFSLDHELAVTSGVDYLQTPAPVTAAGVYNPGASALLGLESEDPRNQAMLAAPLR